MKTRIAGVRILLFVCVTIFSLANITAQKRVLFYGPTHQVGGVAETLVNTSSEFKPIGTGPTDSAIWTPGSPSSASDWSRKTTADFQAFDAIIISDDASGTSPVQQWTAAIANRSTWSSAVTGNVLFFGGDGENHAAQAASFIQAAVRFAAEGIDPGPGLYISFMQAHPHEPSPLDPSQKGISHLLSALGSFTLRKGDLDKVRKLATHPLFDCVTETGLSDWGNSAHSGFTSWPSGYLPLAMVTDAPPELRTPFGASTPGFPNGEKGLVHILAKGADRFFLSPRSEGKLLNSQHTVTLYGPPNQSVLFEVISGPNQGLFQTTSTGSTGVVPWSYTSSGSAGQDVIRVTLSRSAPACSGITFATVDWASQIVTISASDPTAIEPATSGGTPNTGTFTVSRNPAVGSLSLSLAFAGSAASFDYIVTGHPVNFVNGENSKIVTITPEFDDLFEDIESVTATINTAGTPFNYAVGNPSEAFINIVSAPAMTVTLSQTNPTLDESGTISGTLTVHRTSANDFTPFQVSLQFSGTAAFGADYEIEGLDAQGTVTMLPFTTEVTLPFYVVPDTRAENSSGETAIITILPHTDPHTIPYAVGSSFTKTFTITEDDTVQIPAGWKLTDLGTIGGSAARAFGINTIPDGNGGWRGQVVGNFDTYNNTTPYLAFREDNGTSSILWPYPFISYVQKWSHAFSINNASRIVGGSSFYYPYPPSHYNHYPCLWQPGQTTPILLPLLHNPYSAENVARDINNQNYVIGTAINSFGKVHSASWIPDGNGDYLLAADMSDLGGGQRISYAYAINDWGDYVGQSQLVSGNHFHAFRADEHPDDGDDFPDTLDPQLHDMGTATFVDSHQSTGQDINNFGEMVGASQMPIGQMRAGYKTAFSGKNQGWYDLGVLGQGTSAGNQSRALGINDNGLIVGSSHLNVSGVMKPRAFVLSNQGTPGSQPMLDLNASTTKVLVNGVLQPVSSQGWILESALKINNGNWIVGFGTKNGVTHAFRLSPL